MQNIYVLAEQKVLYKQWKQDQQSFELFLELQGQIIICVLTSCQVRRGLTSKERKLKFENYNKSLRSCDWYHQVKYITCASAIYTKFSRAKQSTCYVCDRICGKMMSQCKGIVHGTKYYCNVGGFSVATKSITCKNHFTNAFYLLKTNHFYLNT